MSVLVKPSGPSHRRIIANDGLRRRFRRALTRADVLVVLAVGLILVVISMAMPRGYPREMSYRNVCASNLSSIGRGLYVYASENHDLMPIANHVPAVADEVGRVRYAPGSIGRKRGPATGPKVVETTDKDGVLSTTRNLWTLIRLGEVTAKGFVCPGTKDRPNNDADPTAFWDFASYGEVSYGYQVPYGKHGQPSSECDPRMPLAADKGPYGAALEQGARNPGVPTLGIASPPDDWSPWNSPNHAGEGQKVLFADGHVEFLPKPICAVKNDNIYARWSDPSGGSDSNPAPRIHGTPPTGIETPWSDTDSFIYP